MVFQESETCELKVTVVDDIKKEIKKEMKPPPANRKLLTSLS